MGDTWRGVETSTKTGETDQGVTQTDWEISTEGDNKDIQV